MMPPSSSFLAPDSLSRQHVPPEEKAPVKALQVGPRCLPVLGGLRVQSRVGAHAPSEFLGFPTRLGF